MQLHAQQGINALQFLFPTQFPRRHRKPRQHRQQEQAVKELESPANGMEHGRVSD